MNALELAVINYMPPEYIPALRKALKTSQPDPGHARQCRTDRLEDLIGNAVESIRAKLEQQHQTFRTSAVLDHMWIKRDLYGINRLPTRKVIQRVLVKHGLYVIGL